MIAPARAARPRAVVLWTGGKDSALALHEIRRRFSVIALVTFGPARARFRAHPLRVVRLQSAAIGLPHRFITLRAPYRAAYRRAFVGLRRAGVVAVVTGDIDRLPGCGNWVREIAEPLGLRVVQPLWRRSRTELLDRLRRAGFRVVISYVDGRRLAATWAGRPLDLATMRRLRKLAKGGRLDASGERGEYHTWTLDGPDFRWPLVLHERRILGDGTAAWLDPRGVQRRG